MNQELITKRWNVSREELKQFQSWYKKQNKKTQDKIQEIINYFDISYNDLNKRIKSSDKERLNRKIEEWKELGIYNGYFKYRIERLNKYNINYQELIEILLYGTFMEELRNVGIEISNLYEKVAIDCYNQGVNDLGKSGKKISHSFLDNFNLILIDGIIFADYLDALYLTHMQEIQKQYLISLQQKKKLDIYSDAMQRQFEKQRNRLICVNDEKYSGGLDKYVIALGNMAYLEASSGYNAKVKFISDHCENVTEMCSYMDGMIFNTKKRNVFKRPYGDTTKDLVVQEIDIMGLVIGINQPPISNHFHYCHSTLTYSVDKSADNLREKIFFKNRYKDVTKEWTLKKSENGKVVYAKSINIDGKEYFVGKKNKIHHKNNEKHIAELMVKTFGGELQYLPEIGEKDCIRCGDFLFKKEIWDLKEIGKNATSKTRAVDNILKDTKGQSTNFVIDITNSLLERNNIIEQTETIYSTKNREWIDKIIIFDDNKLLKVYERIK